MNLRLIVPFATVPLTAKARPLGPRDGSMEQIVGHRGEPVALTGEASAPVPDIVKLGKLTGKAHVKTNNSEAARVQRQCLNLVQQGGSDHIVSHRELVTLAAADRRR